ncbi:hypothetical protein GWJ21_15235 [Bacillus coagulans]|uniref:hypothetical protein n=1 Tax=Heyndrickxia coagulans TaxID=1398 RepID=UPI0013770EFB|nr:hypothetical protein [Heyndrickxia coagulans]NCG69205.1 hypothetical protein [Heyndrickxia coagulans]
MSNIKSAIDRNFDNNELSREHMEVDLSLIEDSLVPDVDNSEMQPFVGLVDKVY